VKLEPKIVLAIALALSCPILLALCARPHEEQVVRDQPVRQ
jgi:hypothetical protein